jgi:type I restriction enzyme M protein
MANSAADARGSELEIRRKLIKSGDVDVIVSIGSNFFFTVTLPCTLWFFDRNKKKTLRKDTVLFIDARNTFTQIDRAHRDFSPTQLEFLANIVRLYRGNEAENRNESGKLLKEHFPKMKYKDVAGLCKSVSLKEIEKQGWSLNPGRYVGIGDKIVEQYDFSNKIEELGNEFELLNKESKELENIISNNLLIILNK